MLMKHIVAVLKGVALRHFKMMFANSDGEHWTGCFTNDAFSRASEEDVREAAAAMRANYDDVDLFFFRKVFPYFRSY